MVIDEALNQISTEFKKQQDTNKALAEASLKEKDENARVLAELKASIQILTKQIKHPGPATPEEPPEEPQSLESSKKQSFKEQLADFERFIKIARGQDDPRTHIEVITNPNLEHLLSSTRLNEKQVRAIVNCKLAALLRPEFQPLSDFADTICKVEISGGEHGGGWGTDKGIELAEAYAPRLASLNKTETTTESKPHWYNRKGKVDPSRADR